MKQQGEGQGQGEREPPHVVLLGEAVSILDNMHDVLSAYRQHQVNGKGVRSFVGRWMGGWGGLGRLARLVG
jgi:hypothetical protein